MIWLLKWLVFGHVHRWEKVDESKIINADSEKVTHRRYYCQCTGCGRFIAFNCW